MSKRSKYSDQTVTRETSGIVPVELERGQIETLAYLRWLERGCPFGSPEDDWYRAEQELRGRMEATHTAS